MILPLLARLWSHISKRRRTQVFLLLILMFTASFAEILSIGAVLPFLAVLTNPEKIINHPTTQSLIHKLGYTTIPSTLSTNQPSSLSTSETLSTQHSALRTQHFASTQYYLSPDKLKAEGWSYYSIGRIYTLIRVTISYKNLSFGKWEFRSY